MSILDTTEPVKTQMTFADALRIETALLQAQYPVLADALGRAHALLQDGKVFPEDDGHSAVVASEKSPHVFYYVNGACTCPAHAYEDAPCKHRLAYRLYQRVADRLATEAECYTVTGTPEEFRLVAHPEDPPSLPVVDVPAIMSTTLTIEGRQVDVKLCDTDDARLLARMTTLLQQYPVPAPTTTPPTEGWCMTHGVQMKWNKGKDGKAGWYSHKSPEGTWCNAKGAGA